MQDIVKLVIVGALLWLVWSAIVGYFFHKVPDSFFSKERLGIDEKSSSRYDKFKIKKWKDLVPEAGALFKDGVSKKKLVSYEKSALETLVIESQRAEFVHWFIFFLTPAFLFFDSLIVVVSMTAYGVIANIPFIAIQRYNRSRCYKALKAP